MVTKVVPAAIGAIVGLVGITIFTGSIIFGIIAGIAVGAFVFVMESKNEKK